MVSCPNCGSPVPKDAQFCLSCGEPMGKSPHEPKVEEKEPKKLLKKKETVIATPPTKPLAKKEITKQPPKESPETEYEKSVSPHYAKKAPSPLVPAILVVVVLVALAVVYSMMNTPVCAEDWQCDSWSECIGEEQSRVCADKNNCGSRDAKPELVRECRVEVIEPNETVEIIPEILCVKQGAGCNVTEDCCNGTCVHFMCWNESTYCGDGYCEGSESCSTCPYDCGECSYERDLAQNVFTDPLKYLEAQGYEDDDYVIIRYFYSPACAACYEPMDIEDQLRGLAANFKDLLVLEIINTQQNLNHASRYAKVGTTIYKPLIRIGGDHPYDVLYGTGLGDKLKDGDILVDVAKLLCKHSDYCEFKDNRVVRTYEATVADPGTPIMGPKDPETPVGSTCPNGVPESEYAVLNPILQEDVGIWLASTAQSVKESIDAFDTTVLESTDLVERRGNQALYLIENMLFAELISLYIDTNETPMDNVCDYSWEVPIPNLFSAVSLIIANVAATVELTDESHCIYDSDLTTCLNSKWAEAGSILYQLENNAFVPSDALDSCQFLGDESLDSALTSLSSQAQDVVLNDLKKGIANSYDVSWDILKTLYDTAPMTESEDDQVVRVVVAENIIQFKIAYEDLKSQGCA